ncbi:hypothetical protein PIB30_064161 [Stylosanthes scabra]|uniref:Uncharacterized protein n=1 Tax=Stylosanthes scabra TaxID=79078 RepID=A0ABU6WLJ5_9FABA|nr:hypothetical protein [Stylosanthes scabra]
MGFCCRLLKPPSNDRYHLPQVRSRNNPSRLLLIAPVLFSASSRILNRARPAERLSCSPSQWHVGQAGACIGTITGVPDVNVTLTCLEGGVNVSVAANVTNGQGDFSITSGVSFAQLGVLLTGECQVRARVPRLPVVRSTSTSLISVPLGNIQAPVNLTTVVVGDDVVTFVAFIGRIIASFN